MSKIGKGRYRELLLERMSKIGKKKSKLGKGRYHVMIKLGVGNRPDNLVPALKQALSFFFFFFFFHTMVSRFCTENRLSFLFLVRVHHTHVRCNLVRKLARTVFMLASVEQSRFFMQQRLLFLSFVFCN